MMTGWPHGRARVFYLVPEYHRPSWGVALLHRHVSMLRRHDVPAWALQRRRNAVPAWLENPAPIRYLNEERLDVSETDVLVVPEVLAHEGSKLPVRCRRIVFVQGAFLILKPFETAISYPELGYEGAMAILPHVAEILTRHFETPAEIVPPFIARYFFVQPNQPTARRKRILLFPKEGYREAGYFDLDILRKLLGRILPKNPDWEILEVTGLSHRQVARLMQESMFMVNLNCLEAFNTTVPEAMAAGCIPFCYEAYGGRDFLHDGDNAFVFPNNEVFGLAATLEEMMATSNDRQEDLARMRREGFRTALRFTEEKTETALLHAMNSWGVAS